MFEIRASRNTDIPAVIRLFRECAQGQRWVPTANSMLWEELVFAKLYFDRRTLFVAERAGQIAGFVHTAFPPAEQAWHFKQHTGCIAMLCVSPALRRQGVARQLVAQAESHLRAHGATTVTAGMPGPGAPFYLGLYGGADYPGVLEELVDARAMFASLGYQPDQQTFIMRMEMAKYAPPVDRRQLQIRRETLLQSTVEPLPTTWWEACTFAPLTTSQYSLFSANDRQLLATVLAWEMDAFSTYWRRPSVGLTHLIVPSERHRRGLGSHLVHSVLKDQQQKGCAVAEAQADSKNTAALNLLKKIGFQQVSQAWSFSKPVA